MDPSGAYLVHENDILEALRDLFSGRFINKDDGIPVSLYDGQIIAKINITKIEGLKVDGSTRVSYGVIEDVTVFSCTPSKAIAKKLKIVSDRIQEKKLFKEGFNFNELGIGGLDKEFQEIFRRAFNSRRYPPSVI